jgi:glycine/D-amino acid oxidase-like deaminating enzyme
MIEADPESEASTKGEDLVRVLIVGGGVIGSAAACFLARSGADVTVVERTGVACAASGKSGGFLALDWCDGSPLEPLARRSFALHAALPEEIGGDLGYRRMEAYGGTYRRAERARDRQANTQLEWVADDVGIGGQIGSTETTAQVDPGRFTQALMQAAIRNGASLRISRVEEVLRDAAGRVRGVRADGEEIAADAIVIAMGPWSMMAANWLPLPRVLGLKGHSLIYETGKAVPAQALFLEHADAGGVSAPEIFPRADGTPYICGISSESPVPGDPAAVAADPGALDRLQAIAEDISPLRARSPVLKRQACFRPVTRDGLPLIGAIPGAEGAYVATGHSVWGILNAPATGEALAELILDGRTSNVDLSPFLPDRLPVEA